MAWFAAAVAVLLALTIPLWVAARGRLHDRLVAVQLATVIAVDAMIMLSFAFGRASLLDIPLMVTFLSLPGTLLLAIFLGALDVTLLLLVILFLMAAGAGTAVVLSRDPRRQVMALAVNGLVLALLFLALQAPDVALSEVAVGMAAVPLLFLAALASIRTDKSDSE